MMFRSSLRKETAATDVSFPALTFAHITEALVALRNKEWFPAEGSVAWFIVTGLLLGLCVALGQD